jgi:hypothetical protein
LVFSMVLLLFREENSIIVSVSLPTLTMKALGGPGVLREALGCSGILWQAIQICKEIIKELI